MRAANDRGMGDDINRRPQYSLKWALAQVTLCGVAFACLPTVWNSVSREHEPPLLVFIGLCSAAGAIVGGFFHRFVRGAVIGAAISLPVDVLFCMHLLADFPHGD